MAAAAVRGRIGKRKRRWRGIQHLFLLGCGSNLFHRTPTKQVCLRVATKLRGASIRTVTTLPHLYVRVESNVRFYYCSSNTGHIVMMMAHYYYDINNHTGFWSWTEFADFILIFTNESCQKMVQNVGCFVLRVHMNPSKRHITRLSKNAANKSTIPFSSVKKTSLSHTHAHFFSSTVRGRVRAHAFWDPSNPPSHAHFFSSTCPASPRIVSERKAVCNVSSCSDT